MVKKLASLIFIFCLILSCEEIIEVPDISDQQVELLAPTDQSVVTDTIVNFNWNGVYEANAYLIQIATPNFENASQIVLDSTMPIDSTFVGTRISQRLSSGMYEWRVRALNSDFSTDFSANSFTVETPSN